MLQSKLQTRAPLLLHSHPLQVAIAMVKFICQLPLFLRSLPLLQPTSTMTTALKSNQQPMRHQNAKLHLF